MRFCLLFAALLALGVPVAKSDIRSCACDLVSQETPARRACSLCLEAEKHPLDIPFFLVKDLSASKPNRWLALPRGAFDGPNPLPQMSAEGRLALLSLAVVKAKEVWGDNWGIAMNGDISRTQCHLHVHIGKLLENQEPADYKAPESFPDLKRAAGVYITRLAEVPAIADGTGFWLHPAGTRFHLHVGEQTTESVLSR